MSDWTGSLKQTTSIFFYLFLSFIAKRSLIIDCGGWEGHDKFTLLNLLFLDNVTAAWSLFTPGQLTVIENISVSVAESQSFKEMYQVCCILGQIILTKDSPSYR